jgi:hypothetical protein
VLKDIWGLSDRAVERVALWMADALVAAALRETERTPPTSPQRTPARRRPATKGSL